jgi:hypothetical protein
MYTLCYKPNGFPMMVTTGDCKTRRKPLFPLQAGSTAEKFIARQMIFLAITGKLRRISYGDLRYLPCLPVHTNEAVFLSFVGTAQCARSGFDVMACFLRANQKWVWGSFSWESTHSSYELCHSV